MHCMHCMQVTLNLQVTLKLISCSCKLKHTNKRGATFMSTRSITVNTDFVVMSNLQGRSMKAFSQYRT